MPALVVLHCFLFMFGANWAYCIKVLLSFGKKKNHKTCWQEASTDKTLLRTSGNSITTSTEPSDDGKVV